MANSDNIILVFMLYSLAMFILPLLTFFAVKNTLEKEFHVTGFVNTAWSVILSVVVANLIIISYTRRALRQEIEEEKSQLESTSLSESQMISTKSKIFVRPKNVTVVLVSKPRYVRVNTLFHTPDEIIKIFRNDGWEFIPTPDNYTEFLHLIVNLKADTFLRDFHIKELLIFPGNTQLYENELYQEGKILLQDKASCFPAFLLQPAPNSVTLDMCAAPGMKTTHLSALMRNKGKIYATEIDPKRHKVLTEVVNNAGCTNVTTLNIDALKLNQNESNTMENIDLSWCNDVEYILVDPSCSGSGIVGRVDFYSHEKKDPIRMKKLCGFQFKLLMHALTKFPNVKRVVYSTCSIYPEENESVVEDVLKAMNEFQRLENLKMDQERHPQFKLVEPLKESWSRRGSNNFKHGKCCIFSDPIKDLTNGFFIAVFERFEEEIEYRGKIKKYKNKELKNENDDSISITDELCLTKKKKVKHERPK